MKSGGFLNIPEFSKVQDQIFSKIYDFYSFNVIPKIGKLISNDSDVTSVGRYELRRPRKS